MTSSRSEAERDGVVVPLTLEDYCIKTKVKPDTEPVDMADFYDDDYDIDDDDDDDEELSDNGKCGGLSWFTCMVATLWIFKMSVWWMPVDRV